MPRTTRMRANAPQRRIRGAGAAVLGIALALGVQAAGAEPELTPPPADPVSAPAPGPAPVAAVPLDSLLKLPDSVEVGVERRGKASETEWRSRFVNAQLELVVARKELAESQQSLEEMASSGQWSFSPPGVNVEAGANVDAHQLRMDIKRQRAELERAERNMRELEVEANLANVPESWRQQADAQPAPGAPAGGPVDAPAATR